MAARQIHINCRNDKIPLIIPNHCSVARLKRILSKSKLFRCDPSRLIISVNGKILPDESDIDSYVYLEVHNP